MKKYLKVMLVLVVALSVLCTFAFAAADDNPFSTVVGGGGSSTSLDSAVSNLGASAISVVQTLGYVIAVIMVIVVGIQWLVGTPAKKQELKGRLINVIVGALLIACGVTILGFISKVGNEIGNKELKGEAGGESPMSSVELLQRA